MGRRRDPPPPHPAEVEPVPYEDIPEPVGDVENVEVDLLPRGRVRLRFPPYGDRIPEVCFVYLKPGFLEASLGELLRRTREEVGHA